MWSSPSLPDFSHSPGQDERPAAWGAILTVSPSWAKSTMWRSVLLVLIISEYFFKRSVIFQQVCKVSSCCMVNPSAAGSTWLCHNHLRSTRFEFGGFLLGFKGVFNLHANVSFF